MIFVVSWYIFSCFGKSLGILSFLNPKRIFSREVEDNALQGSFNTVVYLGSKVKISCFGKKIPLKDVKNFSWEHSSSPLSSDMRYYIDKSCALTIASVTVEDAGMFTCNAKTASGWKKFKHNMKVAQLPSASLHVYFTYSVKRCSEKSEDTSKRFIESKLKGKICRSTDCKISLIHSSCYSEKLGTPGLRVTVPVVIPEVPNGACDIDCSRKKLRAVKAKITKDIVDLVMKGKGLKLPEESEEMSVSTYDAKEDMICDPGFQMKNLDSRFLCTPCAPGHFLNGGSCIPCHLNYYSDRYAATECRLCDENRVTRSRGAKSQEECLVAESNVVIIILLMTLIPVPFLLICCCWCLRRNARNSALGKCIDVCCYILLCDFKSLKFARKSRDDDLLDVEEQEVLQSPSSEKSRTGKTSSRARRSKPTTPSSRSRGRSIVRDWLPSVPGAYGSSRKVSLAAVDGDDTIPKPPAMPTKAMLKEATRSSVVYTGLPWEQRAPGNFLSASRDPKRNDQMSSYFSWDATESRKSSPRKSSKGSSHLSLKRSSTSSTSQQNLRNTNQRQSKAIQVTSTALLH